jgi:hypothetical protein
MNQEQEDDQHQLNMEAMVKRNGEEVFFED